MNRFFFLTPESVSALIGVIVILVSITYSRLQDTNFSTSQKLIFAAKTTFVVLICLSIVWVILYQATLLVTDQQPNGFYTMTSGIAGVVLIVLSYIISREVILRAVKKVTNSAE